MSNSRSHQREYLHVLDGRIRLSVMPIKGSVAMARRLEEELGKLPGTTEVQANHVTANVLVLYDSTLTSLRQIVAAISRWEVRVANVVSLDSVKLRRRQMESLSLPEAHQEPGLCPHCGCGSRQNVSAYRSGSYAEILSLKIFELMLESLLKRLITRAA